LAWWVNLLAQFYPCFLFLTIKMLIPGEDLDKIASCGIMIVLKLLGFAALGVTSVTCDDGTELMNMASFWAFGHMEACAPMAISAMLVKKLMDAPLIAPESTRKTEHAPKGQRPKRRVQKMLSGCWAHHSKTLMQLMDSCSKRPGRNARRGQCRKPGRQKPGKCCSSKQCMRIRQRAVRCIKRDKKIREDGQKKDAESQANSPVWRRGCRC
jgi:hypothetical protein